MASSLFVSYVYPTPSGGHRFGNHILSQQPPPASEGDFRALEARLRTAIVESRFTILNWIVLSASEGQPGLGPDMNGPGTPDV